MSNVIVTAESVWAQLRDRVAATPPHPAREACLRVIDQHRPGRSYRHPDEDYEPCGRCSGHPGWEHATCLCWCSGCRPDDYGSLEWSECDALTQLFEKEHLMPQRDADGSAS